jgi:hypothetical protein
MDKHGTIFVNRRGTSSVMRVDKSLLSAIAIHPYEWRSSRLWSLSRVDLVGIERSTPQQPTLMLTYDDNYETWHGKVADKGVSDELEPAAANILLGALEALEVTRWLSPSDADANSALAQPALTLTVEERKINDLGETSGVEKRELKFAPMPGAAPPQFYYGRLTGDTHPFLLDRSTFGKLAVEVLVER